jgi:murein DD-endopeptidase MepM/ murein hydrolase activator NlpD
MSYENAIKIDSLQYEIQKQSNYIHAMNLVISGQMPLSKMENVKDSMKNYEDIEYTTSKADEILRAEIENTNVYDALKKSNTPSTKVSQITSFASNRVSDIFYLPLQGTVIRDFDRGEKHFGIDISGKKQAIIRAIQNGTIISADWSPTFAYVISIQHSNNMTSVYKYNSAILKQVGDHVKAGEPIGFIGNFGDNYKGPMLHFELWYNGSPVNPKDYIPL